MLAVGGEPGSHEPSEWESFFAAYAYADEGDPGRGLAEIEAALAEKPDSAVLLYHLACMNARLGRLDEARTALDRAVGLDPKFAKWAEDDDDLEPLR